MTNLLLMNANNFHFQHIWILKCFHFWWSSTVKYCRIWKHSHVPHIPIFLVTILYHSIFFKQLIVIQKGCNPLIVRLDAIMHFKHDDVTQQFLNQKIDDVWVVGADELSHLLYGSMLHTQCIPTCRVTQQVAPCPWDSVYYIVIK